MVGWIGQASGWGKVVGLVGTVVELMGKVGGDGGRKGEQNWWVGMVGGYPPIHSSMEGHAAGCVMGRSLSP